MSKIVAIILGNRVNDDGTITKIQEERLEMAVEIEKEFNPDYFILTGGSPNKKAGISEAEGMYNYLIKKGFNKDKLIIIQIKKTELNIKDIIDIYTEDQTSKQNIIYISTLDKLYKFTGYNTLKGWKYKVSTTKRIINIIKENLKK